MLGPTTEYNLNSIVAGPVVSGGPVLAANLQQNQTADLSAAAAIRTAPVVAMSMGRT